MDRPASVGLASSFMMRFAGMERAYGTYTITETREDGKQQGDEKSIKTHRSPVTLDLWEGHLSGKQGIGIIPIREANDCFFGAIDIDIYPLDHRALVQKLSRANLPLVVCRTKSGGAHLYCFTRMPVTAAKMKSKLGEVAAFLGYGKSEIFPKQSSILVDQGDVGQWINMPYFNGLMGMRYAVDSEGNAMEPEEFLAYAEEIAVEEKWFSELVVTVPVFDDGPPCLQTLAQIGYPAGTRNNGLYNIGVYAKRSKPDSWEKELEDLNHKYMSPPLTGPEVQGVAKSLRKNEAYTYACSKQPISEHCNPTLCRTRKFGISSSTSGRFPMLGGLTKLNTKPPIWFWTVDGHRMELLTNDLQDPRAFQRKCMDYLNVMPQLPSLPVWLAAVQHAMDSVTVIDAPDEASPEGQFWEMVDQFCSRRAQARILEEIVTGKPRTENGRTFFRLQDLINFLSQHKFFNFQAPKIASLLKEGGAEHHFANMKGRGVNYWSIPAFDQQTESFDVPDDVKGKEDTF